MQVKKLRKNKGHSSIDFAIIFISVLISESP